MAAALMRRETGACVRYIHRELCRLVWRPQTALFSTKASDRKEPRRTHIKKAKPQPRVDVAKLLEQLYSQRRPGTGSPVDKAQHVRTSSTPPSFFTAAPVGPPEVAAIADLVEEAQTKNTDSGVTDALHTAKEVPIVETQVESPVETSHFTVETLDTRVAVDGPVEPTIETTPDLIAEAKSTDTAVDISQSETLENFLETSVEPALAVEVDYVAQEIPNESTGPLDLSNSSVVDVVEPSDEVHASQEALENKATVVVSAVVDTADHTLESSSTEAGSLNLLDTAEEPLKGPVLEPALETTPQETIEIGAAAFDFPLEPKIDAAGDSPAQLVQNNTADSGHFNISETAEGETIVEPNVEASTSALETTENTLDVPEEPVEIVVEIVADEAAQAVQVNGKDLEVVSATEEPSAEITIQPMVEASTSFTESRATLSESEVEPTLETKAADNVLLHKAQDLASFPLEPTQDSLSGFVGEEVKPEQMTLESVTLHGVQVQVQSLESEELIQTNSFLNEKAEEEFHELLMQDGSGAVSGAAAEAENLKDDESKPLGEVLSEWDSLSEDLQELEGESGALVKELLFHVPAIISKTPDLVSGPSAHRDTEEKEAEAEAMTMESITLANVKAEVRVLETDVLLETRNELEKKADILAKEEKMEATTKEEEEEDAVFDSTTEAELLSLESIEEATEAIEAETSIILEAMFGSEQGSGQPPETKLADPKLAQQDEVIGQESEKDSEERERTNLEAMTLESVTLAEVEASFGNLESDLLGETSDYLEKEAAVLAEEKKMVVKDEMVSEEVTDALNIQSLSLPEDEALSGDLQVDELMEELLFSVPGPLKGVTEGLTDQMDAGAKVSDANVQTLAEVADDFSAAPAPSEMLQEQEMEEVTEAQTDDLENIFETETQTELDPVQRLFLEKIREYSKMRKLNDGLLEDEPDYKKNLSEEAAKLQRLYGGGDLSKFPEFSFTEPEMDQDSK
ncbi:uncharacterized protein LOC141795629 [Halichoeres trimaculatus]|uniref:uncharacterized protein LOC141795629 n=1 Tax=Halichoeres trimaculatus TaxID=147232 RepID=UPI003D9F7B45